MDSLSTRTYIRWRGDFYLVQYSVTNGTVSVQVEPPNAELQQAVQQSVEQDKMKQLAVYKGFGYDYLLNDPNRGEPA